MGKSYWSGLLERAKRWREVALARSLQLLLGLFAPSEQRFLSRPNDYAAWLEVNHVGPGAQDDLQAALTRHERLLPLISIVMPVFRPHLGHFLAAIQSVERQFYPHWELCICDDGNDDKALLDELDRIVRGPLPVRLAAHPTNRGIAAATNSAAALAKGELLLFLDQDDLLSPDSLGEFALAFLASSEIDLIYSDSDKVDAKCQRTSPSFKPGWSPWLLLSHMYPSHAIAVRRSLFEAIGGFALGLDGSQDYDLFLRASEQARSIEHIPRVLYHWRAAVGSTALAASEKPDSIEAGRAAVAAAFARRGIPAEVVRPQWSERAGIGLFAPSFQAPESIDVLVLTDNGQTPDGAWLHQIGSHCPPGTRMVVMAPEPPRPHHQYGDSLTTGINWLGSTDNLANDFRRGLRHAKADVTLCILAGVQPATQGWVAKMCGYAAHSLALVGTRVIGNSGKLVGAGLVNPTLAPRLERAFVGLERDQHGPIYLARTTHEVLAATGECLAIGRAARTHLAQGNEVADDPISLGWLLSRQIQAVGGTVLVCGDVEVERTEPDKELPPPGNGRDQWYNPNLDKGARQFLPAFKSPGVRQKDPIRVAVVSHNLDREGAQSTLLDLIEGLVSRDFVVPVVVSSRPGQLGDDLSRMGIQVEIVATPDRKASRGEISAYRSRLASTFRLADAQAVLANTLESYCAVAASVDAGLATIWWQHEGGRWSQYFARLPLWRQAIAFGAFGAAYRVVQVAEDTRRKWWAIRTRENFEVVRPGIPIARLNEDRNRWTTKRARAALGIRDDQLCIVLLGSVSRRKSQGDVIRALAQIPKGAVANLRVLIVGALVDQAYHIELQAMLARLPQSHRGSIELTGNVPDAALYLAAADAFLCCSRQESAPRAIVEAMAFGLPVLTTPVDGIPELVSHGQNGFFYQPGDISGLSTMIQRLIDDRSICRGLSAKAIESFSILNDYEAMVDRFAKLLREAAWQRRSPRLGGVLVN